MLGDFNSSLFLGIQNLVLVGIEPGKFGGIQPAVMVAIDRIKFPFDEGGIVQRIFAFIQIDDAVVIFVVLRKERLGG